MHGKHTNPALYPFFFFLSLLRDSITLHYQCLPASFAAFDACLFFFQTPTFAQPTHLPPNWHGDASTVVAMAFGMGKGYPNILGISILLQIHI